MGNRKLVTTLSKIAKFDLVYCLYTFLFSKINYNYHLSNNTEKLNLSGFKKIKYEYPQEEYKKLKDKVYQNPEDKPEISEQVPDTPIDEEKIIYKLIVSGCVGNGDPSINSDKSSRMNGTYYLIDNNAIGQNRIWKHESEEYYIKIRNNIEYWVIVSGIDQNNYFIWTGQFCSAPFDEETLTSFSWHYKATSLPENFQVTPVKIVL